MSLTITQVDAFADRPLAGNPAAVCILEQPGEEAWMQHVAREMNLSETAFLVKREHGYDLRWFTPTVEVDLCGHATLASAHVLWEQGDSTYETAYFIRSLACSVRGRKGHGSKWIFLPLRQQPSLHRERGDGWRLWSAKPEALGRAVSIIWWKWKARLCVRS